MSKFKKESISQTLSQSRARKAMVKKQRSVCSVLSASSHRWRRLLWQKSACSVTPSSSVQAFPNFVEIGRYSRQSYKIIQGDMKNQSLH